MTSANNFNINVSKRYDLGIDILFGIFMEACLWRCPALRTPSAMKCNIILAAVGGVRAPHLHISPKSTKKRVVCPRDTNRKE